MATKKKSSVNIDVSAAMRGLGGQFRGLDTRDPSVWPAIPRYALLALVAAIVIGLLWFVWVKASDEELEAERAKEVALRTDYQAKVQRAVSLEALKKQRAQVLQYVTVLEKQLPSKAEMDALLSDINQAGLGRSLQFELFRPGQVVVKEYYAELPIALKMSGRYHDMGAFAADVANLSRIVTLNNIAIAPATDKDKAASGALVMEATAKTFRYLDPEEIQAQRAAASKPGAKK
jgi:type IV pilus assembly protein PilO